MKIKFKKSFCIKFVAVCKCATRLFDGVVRIGAAADENNQRLSLASAAVSYDENYILIK